MSHSSVFEIKVLFCAPAGCKDPKNGAPDNLFMCYSLYKPIQKLRKSCTHPVHRFRNPFTCQPKCAHRVQGAPLILNTANFSKNIHLVLRIFLVLSVYKMLQRSLKGFYRAIKVCSLFPEDGVVRKSIYFAH